MALIETTLTWEEMEEAVFLKLEKTGLLLLPGAEMKQIRFDEITRQCVVYIEGETDDR